MRLATSLKIVYLVLQRKRLDTPELGNYTDNEYCGAAVAASHVVSCYSYFRFFCRNYQEKIRVLLIFRRGTLS